MTDVTIHGFAPSTYTRSARMAATEKQVAHRLVPLEYGQASHMALHPFGKMPVLTHGDVTVFETLAVIAYLDATFPGPVLLPTEGIAQARALAAISAAIDYGYRPLVHAEADDADAMATAGRMLDWLDASLTASPWLAGPALSAADLVLMPMVDFHAGRFDRETTFGRRPALADWHGRMSRRDSFTETGAEAA